MAAEFQTHVDEMVREADLSEVRASINEIRNFDFRGRSRRRSMRTARSAPRSRPIRWRRARRARRPRSRRSRSASRWSRQLAPTGGTGGGRDAVRAAGAGLRAAEPGACRRRWRTRASRSRRRSFHRMSRSSAARVRQPDPTTMADIEQDDPIDDKPMPLLEHLIELRRRLMWAIGAFVDLLHRIVLLLQPHLLLPGRAAGDGAARAGQSRSAPDLHAALRGVLHAHQGGVLRRRVHRVPDHRQPDLAVRRARSVPQREARVPAVPGGDAGAVPARRGAGLLLRVPVRLAVLRQLPGSDRRRRRADRAAAARVANISTW